MTVQEFFVRRTPKLIIIRCLLAIAVVSLLIPLAIRFAQEDFTARTFFRYLFFAGFPAVMLTVIHLVGWRVEARPKDAKVYDERHDA